MSESIRDRVKAILGALPADVLLVAAAKTRTPAEALQAIDGGVRAIGHNYIQQASAMHRALSAAEPPAEPHVRWHLIGHLQRNKAKTAAALFDMIETIDSVRLARTVDRHCADLGKVMPVLVEVNSGEESSKTGVAPDEVEDLIREVALLPNIRVEGLMTMGPAFGDPADARPYFRLTKGLFDRLSAAGLPTVEMRYLSMGMSNSYEVAIEEGANIVRIGTKLFGARSAK